MSLPRTEADGQREGGFALVMVIWAIGIISLLALSFIGAARYRVQAAANIAEAARAEALAEAGVNIAKLDLVSGLAGYPDATRFRPGAPPVRCSMPQGGVAAIAIDDEGGKIDLNAASPKLFELMLAGFGAAPDHAQKLAAAIADFGSTATDDVLADAERRDYAVAGRPYGPKKALFETTLELDQVIGMPHDLFRSVLPYVTVHSRRPGVDPQLASPVLLAALDGANVGTVAAMMRGEISGNDLASLVERLPLGVAAPSARRSFLIHVEVSVPGQSVFVREAIVELANGPKPLLLREWRRGERRPGYLVEPSRGWLDVPVGSWPDC